MTKKTQQHIMNVLRRGTLTWHCRSEILKKNSKKVWEGRRVKSGKNRGAKILKTFYKCEKCLNWFRDIGNIEVDHIIEVGPFKGDIHDYALRMYSEGNLQCLCTNCHLLKTNFFNASLRFERKKTVK